MSEACEEVIKFLFSLGYNFIRVDAAKENVASNKVIQKCGGQFVSEYKDYFPIKEKEIIINQYIIEK